MCRIRTRTEEVKMRRLTGLAALAGLTLGMAQPANASWSWKSALTWSYSAAACTSATGADGATRFAFGATNTRPSANCTTVTAFANAFAGWGGGAGTHFVAPGATGSYGPGAITGPVSGEISTPSFSVGTTQITFNGTGIATQSGSGVESEIGAFLFTGNPTVFASVPPTDIEGLVSMGIISPSDVLVDLDNGSIPSTFTSLAFNRTISASDEASVVFSAFSESVPEPASITLLGVGILALIAARRLQG